MVEQNTEENAPEEKVLADAWLYTCKKPGMLMTYASVDDNDSTHWPIDQWKSVIKEPLVKISSFPPPELTWLYTHCRAIGMVDKSDSGKWEHDIALFTIKQQERIKELEDAVIYKQAYFDHINDRNHTKFGTRDYALDPVKSFEHYLNIREQEAASHSSKGS